MSKNFELLRLLQQDSKNKTLQVSSDPVLPERLPDSARERSTWVRATRNKEGMRALATLQKYWRTSVLFALTVFGGTALATFLTKPVYEPTVTLEIDPPGTQAFTLERGALDSNDAEYLETQSKMLDSDELALGVIRKLHLDQDPDFARPPRFRPNVGSTVNVNQTIIELSPQENAALLTFKSRLKVRRDTSSRMISLSFASHDPRTAAQVANELVSEFNDNNFKALHEAILQSSAFLSRQLDDIRAKMNDSSQALVEFQKKTGIVDLDTNKSTLADEVSTLDQQLASARADRIQLEAQLGKAKDGDLESLPQGGNNQLVQNLLQKLADARTELSQAEVDYGKNHPKVKKLQNEIAQLQTELDAQRRRIFQEMKTSYASAQTRERILDGEQDHASRQLSQMAEYNSLKKELQTESDLYNTLYTRVKEAGIAAASKSSNVRLIDHARVLQSPTRPRIALNLGIGFIAALFGGVMLAFIREVLETKIRTPEDILDATGIPSVSVLPMINEHAMEPALSGVVVHRLKSGKNGNVSVSRFLLDNPSSVEAEAFRGLYTTVALSHGGRPPQTLLVVSGSPGEGKTTIASNLAIALAHRGLTCLVDADMRKGSASRAFGFASSRGGLATVLSGAADIADVIKVVPDVPNLVIVPAGAPDRNPAELMSGEAMHNTMNFLRGQYEFVVFDSPPLLPYADGRVLSTLVDGLIFVGRHGATTRAGMARSIGMLTAIHAAPVLEIVLNGAANDAAGYYYSNNG